MRFATLTFEGSNTSISEDVNDWKEQHEIHGESFLHRICSTDSMKAVEVIESGCFDLNSIVQGKTVLYDACEKGDFTVASALIENGCDIGQLSRGYCAIHNASAMGHTKIMKKLINRGNCINAVAKNGYTPLHEACECDKVEAVQMLLKHPKCDIKKPNHNGKTGFMVACECGNRNVVKAFIEVDYSFIFHSDFFAELMKNEDDNGYMWKLVLEFMTKQYFKSIYRDLEQPFRNNMKLYLKDMIEHAKETRNVLIDFFEDANVVDSFILKFMYPECVF